MGRLRDLAPALAKLFGALGDQVVPTLGELTMTDLCARAPELDDLLPTQKDLVLEKEILIT
ncbi:hypothetical protein BGX24_003646, partial [Mortierella sp. AD032]